MDRVDPELEAMFESPDFSYCALHRALIRRILLALQIPLLNEWFQPEKIINKIHKNKLCLKASNIYNITTFPLKCNINEKVL
jgi:hypothetical protein